MSIYVFYSDQAAQTASIFWCTVMTQGLPQEEIVPVTHTFKQKSVPDTYQDLKLEYKGQFVSYATRHEYDEQQKKKAKDRLFQPVL